VYGVSVKPGPAQGELPKSIDLQSPLVKGAATACGPVAAVVVGP
jgi:hypothetical protein